MADNHLRSARRRAGTRCPGRDAPERWPALRSFGFGGDDNGHRGWRAAEAADKAEDDCCCCCPSSGAHFVEDDGEEHCFRHFFGYPKSKARRSTVARTVVELENSS